MIKITNKNGDVKKLQEVEDTGWVSLNSVVYYRVKNGHCTINVLEGGSNAFQLKAQEYTNIGTLPIGCRPTIRIEFCPHFIGGLGLGTRGYITKEGDIEIYCTSDAGHYGASVSYPI